MSTTPTPPTTPTAPATPGSPATSVQATFVTAHSHPRLTPAALDVLRRLPRPGHRGPVDAPTSVLAGLLALDLADVESRGRGAYTVGERTRTGQALLDDLVDAHELCSLCLGAFRIEPRSDTTPPLRICTGERAPCDPCGHWEIIREGEPGWTPQPACRECDGPIYGTSAAHRGDDGRYVHTDCEPPRRVLFGLDRLRRRWRAATGRPATRRAPGAITVLARAIDLVVVDLHAVTDLRDLTDAALIEHARTLVDPAELDTERASGEMQPETADAYEAVRAATPTAIAAALDARAARVPAPRPASTADADGQLADAISLATTDWRHESGPVDCSPRECVDAIRHGGMLDHRAVDDMLGRDVIDQHVAAAYRAVLDASWSQLNAALAHLEGPR